MPSSKYAKKVRKCAVCGEPAPRAGLMICVECSGLMRRIGGNHRLHEGANATSPPPSVDPTRKDRIEKYAERAAACLPLFG